LFEESLLPRQLLGSVVNERSLPAETMGGCSETVNLDANEAGSVWFGQCFFLRWMRIMRYAVDQSRGGF